MKTRLFAIFVVILSLLPVIPTVRAQWADPVVTFSDFDDAIPNATFGFLPLGYFDPTTTAPELNNPNKLIIGLKNFVAGKYAPPGSIITLTAPPMGHDTISFRVTAPDGYFLSTVTYELTGTTSVSRIGFASLDANGVVDGKATNVARTTPTVVDLTGQQKTSVMVSLSAHVSAGGYSNIGSATAQVTSAAVSVGFTPAQ